MAEHAWILERLASYTAGGLEPAERGRFEAHIAACVDCACALDEVKRLDHNLDALFADARPRPGLEDRMIEELRRTPLRLPLLHSPHVRALMGAAAVLMFGMVGAGATLIAENGLSLGQSRNATFSMVAGSAVPESSYAIRIEETESNLSDGAVPQSKSEPAPTAAEMANRMLREMRRGVNTMLSDSEKARAAGDITTVDSISVPGPVNPNEQVGTLGDARDDRTKHAAPVMAIAPQPTTPAMPPGLGGQPGGYGGFGGGVAPTGATAPGKDSAGYWQYEQDKREGRKPGENAPANGGKGKEPYYSYRNEDRTKAPPTEGEVKKLEEKLKEGKPSDPAKFEEKKEDAPARERPAEPADPKGEPAPAPKPDPKPEPKGVQPTPEEVPVVSRKIIRSGEIEFEIDSFEHSVERVTKVATEERGFIATVNSEKLPNGKVRGTVVVRCPPDRLDTLLLKLRALGDLKSQRIGSQDVTKMYTDIESELRGARAMESRLIEIIKTGGGQIKDLLVAEKELGTWRTKIEKMEGEIRYYNNLISLSTLSITLTEKEIRAAFGVTETEKVEMGIEVEDVEKGQQDAHTLINDAKGRILKSELKQSPNGQYQALISFEAAPDAAGALRDRLKQLGVVSRLEIGRLQQVEGGSTRPVNAKTERSDTQFHLSLYNIASVMPRETTQLTVVCHDTESAYQTVINKLNKLTGARVLSSPLERSRGEQVSATVNFEVKAADADGVLNDLKALGEVMRHQVTEQPEGNNVTKSKRGFNVALWAVAAVKPRETHIITIATREVPDSYKALQEAVNAAKGRVLHAQLNEQDRNHVTGTLDFEVRRGDETGIVKALGGAGEVLTRNVARAQENEGVIDSKVRYQFSIVNIANTRPRETVQVVLASRDVPASYRALQDEVSKAKGWVLQARLNEADRRNIEGHLTFEVRRSEEAALLKALGVAGDVQKRDVARAADAADVVDTKVRYQLALVNVANIPPRETMTLGIEVNDVDASVAALAKLVAESKGRAVESHVARLPNGTTTAKMVYDVPLSAAETLTARFKNAGIVRTQQSSRNPAVPDSELAIARLDIVLSNSSPIVSPDGGPWDSMKKGLSYSMVAIGYSLVFVIVGVLVVLPWALIAWAFLRLAARFRKSTPTATPV